MTGPDQGHPDAAAALADAFAKRFGSRPSILIRAPGRVNLIGEHTDYNGFPVLPFAIRQSHRIAAGGGDGPWVDLVNRDPWYPARRISVDDPASMSPAGDWENYCRAALLGLVESGLLDRERLVRGLKILVSSDLPAGVGLSSSSALVVGFALSALEVFRVPYDRSRLAETLAEAERHVGTRGGGMDQAVCLLGKTGHALKIGFFPLAVETVPFPDGVCLYLADSGVRVEKSGAGRVLYNQRPKECRLALSAFRGWARDNGRAKLADVRLWGDLVRPPLGFSHREALSLLRQALPCETYSKSDLSSLLFEGESDVVKEETDGPVEEPPGGFRLRQRAEHAIAEGERVEKAAGALGRGTWGRLVALIDESHVSCRDLYEISHPELERLVREAGEAGALASRLTGAGFGGCTLHLTRPADAERFQTEMLRRMRPGQRLFRVEPSAGAETIDPGERR